MSLPPPSLLNNPYSSEHYLQQLLTKAVHAGASDVHLKVGQPPGARVRGQLVYFKVERIRPEDTLAVTRHLLSDEAMLGDLSGLEEHDCSYEIPGVARFRVNIYRQRGSFAVVLRSIPFRVPTMAELGLPEACATLAEKDRGLVLCVGAAGNGKSTTLAAMVDHINHTMSKHIITIEDPIEYVFSDDRCSVSQREIGVDTKSFSRALRAALRQDPDVIHVGEIRDSETMDIALKAAETGHLVFSTLHTPDVLRTVNRILALSESDPDSIRARVGDALQGVIAQRLLRRADGDGRALAAELLVCTGSVRESIRRPHGNPPLKELMEKGEEMYGMQTFEVAVKRLLQAGDIDRDTARTAAGF